jgi:hypothetical protein
LALPARHQWNDLPDAVTRAVEDRFGSVLSTAEVGGGQNCDVAVVLRGSAERAVFVKGVHGVSRRMRWLRNEIAAGALTEGLAPATLFHLDVADWLVVGFEYLPGRPASLAPGSADLPLVASAMQRISTMRAPGLPALRDRWAGADWWHRFAAAAPDEARDWDVRELTSIAAALPALVDGDQLVHTDLHGEQFLIDARSTIHVIDWGFPAAGAEWVDVAFLILRLMEAGHTASDAQAWALAFREIDPVALTAFASYIAGMWSYWAASANSISGSPHRARLARNYLAWRLARVIS